MLRFDLNAGSVQLGCDPELFIRCEGKIVPSEEVIPKDGIVVDYLSKIIRDGIQLEFNPMPYYCRANFGNHMRSLFYHLRNHVDAKGKTNNKKYEISFEQVIKLTDEDIQTINPEAMRLGCRPSLNAYGDFRMAVSDLYPYRSGGGHIHLGGFNRFGSGRSFDPDTAPILAKILDIILGNTCVLIDRDPDQVERRKVYGRAGEYRIQPHGFEYRVLSNFWFRAYPLFSFCMATARTGVQIFNNVEASDYVLNLVDQAKVIQAINENDYSLAYENYLIVKEFFKDHIKCSDSYGLTYAIHKEGIDSTDSAFDLFIRKIKESGLQYWFHEDPLTHWLNLPEGHVCGWETFIDTVVQKEIFKIKREICIEEMKNENVLPNLQGNIQV